MSKPISRFTEHYLDKTKVMKGDFDWDLYNIKEELTDEQEALRQLNALIESIATGNDTYTLDTFKSDIEEVIEEVSND
mgnify:FL=1